MNSEDQFEKRLQNQPRRPVPPAWREGILSAARQAACERRSRPLSCPCLLSTLNSQLSALLWPHPRAWAGLAAIWLLVLGLDFAAREPFASEVAGRAAPPSPQMRKLLQQQEQLLAELVGPKEAHAADRPKPAAAQPRSQRREEIFYI
jgi:hypothetical protein